MHDEYIREIRICWYSSYTYIYINTLSDLHLRANAYALMYNTVNMHMCSIYYTNWQTVFGFLRNVSID